MGHRISDDLVSELVLVIVLHLVQRVCSHEILNMLNQIRGGRLCFDFNFYLCIPFMLGYMGLRLFCQFVKKVSVAI